MWGCKIMESFDTKNNTSLYHKLQSTLYKYGAYKKENLGEGMILVEELKGGYWKPMISHGRQ